MKNSFLILALFVSLSIYLSCGEKSKQSTEPQDNIPPTVTIIFPTNGSIVSEIVKVTCVATDNMGINIVELWIDGVSTGQTDNTEPYSLSWNSTSVSDNSQHIITVRAYDESNNKTDSDPIEITVDNSNSHPTISQVYSVIQSGTSFKVLWSKNNDYDFYSYTLFESLADSTNWSSIFNTSNRQDTTFTVNGVSQNEYRYYKVVTTDTTGLESNSSAIVGSSYQKLVFTAPGIDGLYDIFIIDIHGMAKRNITNYDDFDRFSDFSPDGSKILFSSYRNGNYDLYSVNVDGNNLIRLTNSPENEYDAKFSPDGTKIVYRLNSAQYEELYIMNSDGSGKTRLTDNIGYDRDPNISPDGLKIVFTSYRDDNSEIYKMNSDGSNQVNLTNDSSSADSYPSFFQNGNKILFSKSPDIYKMNSDGSNKENITNYPNAGGGNQQLSPDESLIVFQSGITGSEGIFLIDINGNNLINLSNSPDKNPVFSPDGTKIAFESRRDGNSEIYIMNIDGSEQTNITNSADYEIEPFFQPHN